MPRGERNLRVLSLCSDIGGRKWVYVVSILLYAILNIVSVPADVETMVAAGHPGNKQLLIGPS